MLLNKFFFITKSTILKIEVFSFQQFLKLIVRFFSRHFIEFQTLELNDKTLGFLEFLLFNFNVQDSIKSYSKFQGIDVKRRLQSSKLL